MNDRELLEMMIGDILLLKEHLDKENIDVYNFYEQVISIVEFVENQRK
jgi:hypothetical protein